MLNAALSITRCQHGFDHSQNYNAQIVNLLRGLEYIILEFLTVIRPKEVHQQSFNSSLVSSSIVGISLLLLLAEATVRFLTITVPVTCASKQNYA